MNEFTLYLRLGFEHIADIRAFDHILFLLTLTAIARFKHWKWLIWMVTAFTLCHTLTLIMAGLNIYRPPASWIEFLIPVTILVTALFNLTKAGMDPGSRAKVFMAGVFGLVHGFGFSNYYRMIVLDSSDIWTSLLPFTVGIELGQLLIVLIILLIGALLEFVFKVKPRDWNLFTSGVAFGLALYLAMNNWP
ncbi:MAG: HupE/UreJ family protein [Bacteroidota bacterium]|nr:HupE/UreJ family protein [Bacteroidota bacterium]MDX5448234.1 HupE/UreJ family protein [Bacteroidota bacterium]MDX5505385.1 HupE/UreJ family protein [Bacteroidota bacterium]